MFIGRETELRQLNELYRASGFQCIMLYGRRRVGKTTLLAEFTKDKENVFLSAMETSGRQNMRALQQAITMLQPKAEQGYMGNSFEDYLEYVFKLAMNKRVVLVLDGIAAISKSCKQILKVLAELIDRYSGSSKLFLVLCDSQFYTEKQIFGKKSPLEGKETGRMLLEPFTFNEIRRFFRKLPEKDLALIYGMCGGIPQYLAAVDDRLTIEENIKRLFLTTGGQLLLEPDVLLRQEMREVSFYNAILLAIASGNTRLSEIATEIGEETSATATYMRSLVALGIVKKEAAYGEQSARKTLYKIDDELFSFWYRFIPDNLSLIQNGKGDLVYNRISRDFEEYMDAPFRKICTQYLYSLRDAKKIRVNFKEIGPWWGMEQKTRKDHFIDLVGVDDAANGLFATCTWSEERVGLETLQSLIAASAFFRCSRQDYFLFSKKGFTKECIDEASRMGNVSLVSFM